MPDPAVALLLGDFRDPRAAAAHAAEAAKPFGAEVQLVRPEILATPSHVASAAAHARRALDERRSRSGSVALEFLCYLTGRRQIAQALALGGLPPGATSAVAVVLGRQAAEALPAVAAALAARLDPVVPWRGAAALHLLEARPAQGPVEARALELVALLDVER